MPLGKDSILQAQDIETREINVPEWGGTVLVRGLTGTERDSFEATVLQDRGKQGMVRKLDNIRAKLVARCLVDAEGARLFTDGEAGLLGRKSAAVLDRLYDVAAEMSGLSDEDVEELGKDSSSPTPSEGSISSSPNGSEPALSPSF